jgi:hypothetical protein
MTTWTTISNAAVAVGGIPSSTVVTALRDNPAAMAEQAAGAPVIFSGWHPYNKVSVGDGETGLIYDFAVNGLQANVVTPDFEDGYEYRIVCRDLSHSSGSSQSLRIEFANAGGSYVDDQSTGAVSNSSRVSVDLITCMPRIAAFETPVIFTGSGITDGANSLEMDNSKILRARVSFTGGSIDAGKIWFLRQRCHVSSP